VFHNTPFLTWEAANWTIDTLAARSKDIPHVLTKKGKSNVFKYYAVDKPLSDVESLNTEKDYVEVIFTSKTFFDLLRSPFDGFYYYASGGIELLNLEGFGSEESRRAMTFPSHSKAYSEPGQVNFWLGGTNVTAYTHYDTSHNFHMVVSGRKRFILFPPRAYSRLKLHPCLHPLYRQVDIDVLAQDNLMEYIRELRGFEVELMDGDVLYIPPYWFHTVVTMETTFSLNIWSQSETFLTMEKIYSSPIPFEAEWGIVKLMKSLCHFIQSLLDRFILEEPSGFVVDGVCRRYEVILNKKNIKIEPLLSESVREYCLSDHEELSDLLGLKAAAHLEEGVASIAELFEDIYPLAVREINLANYIEHLTWRILGKENAIQMPLFFHECFNESVS
jgi:hypothetical protein